MSIIKISTDKRAVGQTDRQKWFGVWGGVGGKGRRKSNIKELAKLIQHFKHSTNKLQQERKERNGEKEDEEENKHTAPNITQNTHHHPSLKSTCIIIANAKHTYRSSQRQVGHACSTCRQLLKLVILHCCTARDHERLFQVGGGAVNQFDPALGDEAVSVGGSLVDLVKEVLGTATTESSHVWQCRRSLHAHALTLSLP